MAELRVSRGRNTLSAGCCSPSRGSSTVRYSVFLGANINPAVKLRRITRVEFLFSSCVSTVSLLGSLQLHPQAASLLYFLICPEVGGVKYCQDGDGQHRPLPASSCLLRKQKDDVSGDPSTIFTISGLKECIVIPVRIETGCLGAIREAVMAFCFTSERCCRVETGINTTN